MNEFRLRNASHIVSVSVCEENVIFTNGIDTDENRYDCNSIA